MFFRWFVSSAYRHALAARRHYGRLLAGQRDGLSPEGVAAVLAALSALDEAMAEGHTGRMRIKAEELQFAANQWITPYPRRLGRMLCEVLLLALVLALTIQTFFAEPFKIPTGSMEPTLYGVNYVNLRTQPGRQAPTGWARVWAWMRGYSYVVSVAKAEGMVEQRPGPVTRVLWFNLWQTYWIGDVKHRVWFPPDLGDRKRGISPLIWRPGRMFPYVYKKGDLVINLQRQTGDYLLVDRLTYNFRKPGRGEIVVFKTAGISEEQRARYTIPEGEFYLKRLVGLPGDQVQIGDDRHLIIDGRRQDASAPHFAKVYGFDPGMPPEAQKYAGYLNTAVAEKYGMNAGFAPLFPDADTICTNGPGMCLVMGDNTVESLDSRYWGALSEGAIIGQCWFVFWPLTERFGWKDNR